MRFSSTLSFLFLLLAFGCSSAPDRPAESNVWAIAIHGGAGTMSPDTPPELLRPYEEALTRALAHGRDMLATGASALDVCESVVRLLEDDEHFNAGKGAVFNEQGQHELDASIMDGSTMRCGAVAGVRTVKNPISLARRVMTDTRHVLLAGDGAEKFADVVGVERVENTYFDTQGRRRALERRLQEIERAGALAAPSDRRLDFGTVGCVVRDREGRLAAATSTGGMTAKKWGRIGDSPVIGAGNYADGTAAVSCTGTGEEFIRHAIARSVTARMQFGGQSLAMATDQLIHRVLARGDGGLIAVDRHGNLATPFNTSGMYRGVANSNGLFEIAVFGDGASVPGRE